MKRTKILYWVFTGLLGALMLMSSIPDIISTPEAVEIVTHHLGYPAYFIPFIGVAKLLGVIAILVPGFPQIKEWAYAGLMFDLIGATYSQIANDGFQLAVLFMALPIVLLLFSYSLYHKKYGQDEKVKI